jgi:hypothetical protein
MAKKKKLSPEDVPAYMPEGVISGSWGNVLVTNTAGEEIILPPDASSGFTVTSTGTSISGVFPSTWSYPNTWSYPYGGTIVTPNAQMLQDPTVMPKLIDKMLTVQKPGEKLIVCVDNDFTPQQIQELADSLTAQGVDAIIIPGARAGYGYGGVIPFRDEQRRIDILARIGELWERRPDLALTDLLEWYRGEHATDEDFVAAIEVHFKKRMEQ